jgi:serine/threonine protein kinase
MAVLPPGTFVGRYRIQVLVGQGGMGIVYRALDPALDRRVALKLLAPHLLGNPDALARFRREATAVANLKHPNIATVFELGEHDGQPFIAAEWIEGQTLTQLMAEQGPLPLSRALLLYDQLASALDYAHANGVIHRDCKPSNIIVRANDHATIVDFGLAWADAGPSITATGSIFGTPHYMAPEQIEGKRVDGRADLYALACVLCIINSTSRRHPSGN